MFENITSVENLLEAWREFLRGKCGKLDVQEFGLCLMDNVLSLHRDLLGRTYRHGPYHAFNISDPKPRSIHKATVRDRLLHHAVYRVLYPYFDRTFIADSFSCRVGKGTHKALNRFRAFGYKASCNHIRTCWVLKCDIKKFFASINHATLFGILARSGINERTRWLLQRIIDSFRAGTVGVGLPLGNLTSQLLVNVYMNEFDQYVKHTLKAQCYLRYADDFVVFSPDRVWLEGLLPKIKAFLVERLKLELHPDKVSLRTLASGVDFLGWVHFPDHRVLRTATKRKMLRRVTERPATETLQSYRGLLSHGNARKLERTLFLAYHEHNAKNI
ncbi:MAG: reverse transcriptase/maturase family protein [Candidatus Brennerbacteria bacterium]